VGAEVLYTQLVQKNDTLLQRQQIQNDKRSPKS
ncbi:hypothetical protein F441_13739, partial [Phytophthora nicotianae CJ01A1]